MYPGRREICERTIVEIVENVGCGPVRFSAIAGVGNVGVYATMEGVHGDLEEILYPEDFASEDEVLKAVYDLTLSVVAAGFLYRKEEVGIGYWAAR